jgi:hypothetical protein
VGASLVDLMRDSMPAEPMEVVLVVPSVPKCKGSPVLDVNNVVSSQGPSKRAHVKTSPACDIVDTYFHASRFSLSSHKIWALDIIVILLQLLSIINKQFVIIITT